MLDFSVYSVPDVWFAKRFKRLYPICEFKRFLYCLHQDIEPEEKYRFNFIDDFQDFWKDNLAYIQDPLLGYEFHRLDQEVANLGEKIASKVEEIPRSLISDVEVCLNNVERLVNSIIEIATVKKQE